MNRRAFLGASLAAPAVLSRCSLSAPPRAPQAPPLPGTTAGHHFQNWAETISCRPASFAQPASIDELAELVKAAGRAGKVVRTYGAGHSWAPLVLSNDVQVNLDRMQNVVAVDAAARRVTVQAGARFSKLLRDLDAPRLALPNLGSITQQSLAGATATGTHGTGIGLQNLSMMIVGAKLVTGKGEVVEVTDPERLRALRISVGALGILAEVTLQLVDHYNLTTTAYWSDFDSVVDNLPELVANNERLRLWWIVWEFGNRQQMIVTTMNRSGSWIPGEAQPATKVGRGQLSQESANLMKKRPKVLAGRFHMFNEQENVDYREALFVPLLKVIHRECEYAIPAARAQEALRNCRRYFDEGDVSLKMPVEVRWVAKDDSYLSPTGNTEGGVCYIGISAGPNALEVFQWFEPMMRRLGGRPHWGKYYTLNRYYMKELYPDTLDKFVALRNEWDPQGIFSNQLMRQLFGEPA